MQGDRRDSESAFPSVTRERGTRCASVTGIGARERSETQSRSNEKIIYLPGYIRFQSAQMQIRSLRSASTPMRIHRDRRLHRRAMHSPICISGPVSRRAIKSRQITGAILNTFARRIYLSQCVRMQYPISRDKCSRIKRSEFNIAKRP